MKTAGIICECNPIHGGHEYLIQQARQASCDCIVAVMSGEFVQRGEPAILDPHRRAHLLLLGGADLVVELPFPYSASSAEFFGRGGVEILSRLGVDQLWFGSENGKIEELDRASRAMDDPAFLEAYTASAKGQEGTAEAFFESLKRIYPDAPNCLSNDILALSYLRALRQMKSAMEPCTVKRVGSAYAAERLPEGNSFPSATALRNTWREKGYASILSYLPAGAEPILQEAEQKRMAPTDLQKLERMILGHMRMLSPGVCRETAELGGGLGNRLRKIARETESMDAFLRTAVTKKYPLSRIKRGILFALCHVTEEDLRRSIPFVRLLAANRQGRRFLSGSKKQCELPVFTRRTEMPDTEAAVYAEEMMRRAHDLYTLCMPAVQRSTDLWEHRPVILTAEKI